ncbi:YifB family Mg chelatase-like AAA ATPase [Arcanobacterium haemolyticum]
MSKGIVGRCTGMTLLGVDARPVLIEAAVFPGLPHCSLVGLADTAVNEARERLRASFAHVGLPWPNERVTINLSPAALPKTGTGLDLGVAIALLEAQGWKPLHNKVVAVGELGLDGSVRGVRGILPSVAAAKRYGFDTVLVPWVNAHEARLVEGITIQPVRHLAQVAQWMGIAVSEPYVPDPKNVITVPKPEEQPDMADVYGQETALIGIEVAAVGGHHAVMIGAPGVGKSMIAQRMPGVMPELTPDEALEVAVIRSIRGQSLSSLHTRPPLAAPHHTASVSALVGGGSGIARPGAITAAHRGILFCDEFAEFSPRAIQALREPLENGFIDIARANAVVRFPARFQLVAASNPCKCGRALEGVGACTCTPRELRVYRSKLGGPVRDRIDIAIQLNRPTRADIQHGPTTTSTAMKERISAARERQRARGSGLNSQLPGPWLREHTELSATMAALIEKQLRTGQVSMRGFDRILRVAWSLADLAGHDSPTDDDVALAFTLRTTLESH